MPELPEVETVRRGLAPSMEGAVFERVEINRAGLRIPFPENLKARLEGVRVGRLGRRSKYILVDLQNGETLILHLGMSGRLTVSGDPLGQFHHKHPAPQKHDHVVFYMDNGARVTFNDPRRFGLLDLIETEFMVDHRLFRAMGPEPFSNDFNEVYLLKALARRQTPIKSVLLDQRIVAGLGNIYVCEVLFRAGISPKRKAGALSSARVRSLIPLVKGVLEEAIEAGGSSLKDYRNASGDLGYFQHGFRVYGRDGESCQNTQCSGQIARITQAGRSTFYCPRCQR